MPLSAANAVKGLIARYATRLRFPQLFALAAALFFIDLLIPDLIPFTDEILLGLLTLLLGSWRKERPTVAEEPGEKPPIKDVTPRQGE